MTRLTARTEVHAKPDLQTKDIAVCVLLGLCLHTANKVGKGYCLNVPLILTFLLTIMIERLFP